MIYINKLNECYIQLDLEDRGQAAEIAEHFKFLIPNHRFNPKVKRGLWDGYFRLFNNRTRTLYVGLLEQLKQFLDSLDYQYEVTFDESQENFSLLEAREFISTLGIPEKFTERDYQLKAFVRAIRNKRQLFLSATNSGKTLLQYYIHRYLESKGHRTLIIVPTTTLVHQTIGDFVDYGYDENKCWGIMAGVDKEITDDISVVVSTWQSIVDLPTEWFDQFTAVMGDEAHLYKAKSLTTIMEKCHQAEYRIGLTGTIDDTEIDQMVLTGLFGEIYKVITTHELIQQDYAADVKIKVIVLKHPKTEENKKALDYVNETAYIIKNEKRNKFIKNLALSLKGNTLILYNFVEDHGKVLFDLIKEKHENTFFVSGQVKTDERTEIRKSFGELDDAIVLASYKTFSTGINAPNIHNIIFAQGYKGKIRNLQSIGRGIRKAEGKEYVTLYDIADIFKHKKETYSYKHLLERVKHYSREKFKFKIYEVKIEE